jgi:hypothetical protein
LQRWYVLMYKLTQARTLLSRHSVESTQLALRFLHSARYDTNAIHHLIHRAGQRVRTYFVCDYYHLVRTSPLTTLAVPLFLSPLSPLSLVAQTLSTLCEKANSHSSKSQINFFFSLHTHPHTHTLSVSPLLLCACV